MEKIRMPVEDLLKKKVVQKPIANFIPEVTTSIDPLPAAKLPKKKKRKKKSKEAIVSNPELLPGKPYVINFGKKILIKWEVHGKKIKIPASDDLRVSQKLTSGRGMRGDKIQEINRLHKTITDVREALYQWAILKLLFWDF